MQEHVLARPKPVRDDKLRLGHGVAHVVQESVGPACCFPQIQVNTDIDIK